MAILARVASHGITDQMDLTITVQFFDDNDPANQGVTPPGVFPVVEPGNVLRTDSWTYPPTMSGQVVQTTVAGDIRTRLAAFVRARDASADAAFWVPVGALVSEG